MSADPSQSMLEQTKDPSLWERVLSSVPIFRVNQTRDAKGNLVRVDAARLQRIADNMNRRAREDGVLPVLRLGHPNLDKSTPQHKQPPSVGVTTDHHVGRWGPQGKLGILATCYIRRGTAAKLKNELKDDLKDYMFRSVDFYPNLDEITGVALLKTDPELDMGMINLAYSRRDQAVQFSFNVEGDMPQNDDELDNLPDDDAGAPPDFGGTAGGTPMPGADDGAPPMPDAGPGPGDADGDEDLGPEDGAKAVQYFKHALKNHPMGKHLVKQYGKACGMMQYDGEMPGGAPGGSAPSGGNTFLPGMGGDDTASMAGAGQPMPPGVGGPPMPGPMPGENEAMRMHREQQAIQFARQELRAAELEQRLEEEVAAREALAFQYRRRNVEAELIQLEAEGYQFNRAKLVDKLAALPEAEVATELNDIRQYSRRDRPPVGGGPIRTAASGQPRAQKHRPQVSKEQSIRAHEMVESGQAANYDDAIQRMSA